MYTMVLVMHVLVCVVLMVVVLIQTGKGAGLGGIFGGGSSDALFSAPSGSSFLRKLTVGLAIGFACTTLVLTILQSRKSSRSVIERVGVPQTQGQ